MAGDSDVHLTMQTDYMQWLMCGVQDKGCSDHVEALVPHLQHVSPFYTGQRHGVSSVRHEGASGHSA